MKLVNNTKPLRNGKVLNFRRPKSVKAWPENANFLKLFIFRNSDKMKINKKEMGSFKFREYSHQSIQFRYIGTLH